MKIALAEASRAAGLAEVPVGCVIVRNGKAIAAAHNRVETDNNPLAHAEMESLRLACESLATRYLDDCDIYVTLEPCIMCAAAISRARLKTLYFGAYDSKEGAVVHGGEVYAAGSRLNHRPQVVGGVMEKRCAALLNGSFAALRHSGRRLP